MEKIFGLFLENVLLGVMMENVFLSKSKEELETICFIAIPDVIHSDIETHSGFWNSFDIDTMSFIISADNGMATIEFRELNIIK